MVNTRWHVILYTSFFFLNVRLKNSVLRFDLRPYVLVLVSKVPTKKSINTFYAVNKRVISLMIIDVLLRDKEAQCDTAQKLMARTMISGQDQTIKSNQGLSVEISGVVHIDRALSPPSLISWSSGQHNHGRGIPNLPRKLLTLTTAY